MNRVIDAIRKHDSILIFPHINMDGDALGSSLALAFAIKSLNKEVKIIVNEKAPQVYKFLPGLAFVKRGKGETYEDKLGIALDTGDIERLGKRGVLFDKCELTINIDHHISNTEYADINLVSKKSAATGEIIFKLIKEMEFKIDKNVATCLYTAISTDTGGFRYANTTAFTHIMAAELFDYGIDIEFLSRTLFDLVPYRKAKLAALVGNTLKLHKDGEIAILQVPSEIMLESGALEEDCDGIVNIAREVQGVLVAALAKEMPDDMIKVNLRSNCDIDVARLAMERGGGGHQKAAGYTVKSSMIDEIDFLVCEISELIVNGN